MTEYSPQTNTIEHLEFDKSSGTISVIQDDTLYYIKNVTYSIPSNITFDDMKLSWNNNTFTYSSRFEYACTRDTKYTTWDNSDKTSWTSHNIDNLKKLPKQYANLYYSYPTEMEVPLTFHITGEYQLKTTSEDSAGNSITSYGPLTPWTDQYTIIIETNYTRHAQMVVEALKLQQSYQETPIKDRAVLLTII